ncbi:hypothetical protein [Bauldia sp.]|uniref:hypothetical protein n=1 Tax=Bauldia sp. TaxID=2575872 RepID=UPI003BAB13EA
MIRIYADFNDANGEDEHWILAYDGEPLEKRVEGLGLSVGDKVVLHQDEDDFEVIARLDFRYEPLAGRETWLAKPDWSTLARKSD